LTHLVIPSIKKRVQKATDKARIHRTCIMEWKGNGNILNFKLKPS